MLRNLSEQTKLELGTGKQIFDKDYEVIQTYAASSWITHLCYFIHEQDIRVRYKTTNLEKNREMVQFIMQSVIENDKRKHDMKHLKRCRLYLNVTTLSNILEGDGDKIHKDALQSVL